MTKDEALAKIEELKQFVEEMDKPPFRRGQVWKTSADNYYLVVSPKLNEKSNLQFCRIGSYLESERLGSLLSNIDNMDPVYVGEFRDFETK